MDVTRIDIEGVLLIQPRVFGDDRGSFHESYNKQSYANILGETEFVQDNISVSLAGTLRGLHFQAPPYAQAKLVSVLRGSVLDVCVDLRKDSPTYGQHHAVELSEKNKRQFFIPRGFAHGFLALENDTIFSYKCDGYYHQASEGSLIWNDPKLGIDWGTTSPLLSDKDAEADSFTSFVSPF